jgi:hypothetical protein
VSHRPRCSCTDDPNEYYKAQEANGAAFLQSLGVGPAPTPAPAAEQQLADETPQPIIGSPPFEGPDPTDQICAYDVLCMHACSLGTEPLSHARSSGVLLLCADIDACGGPPQLAHAYR